MATTKTLGRADDNDVILPSQYIGRKHATITRQDDGTFLVKDLNSLSGTFVNGHKIMQATITLKDKVSLADTEINLVTIFQLQTTGNGPKAKSDTKDFTDEFQQLRKVYDDYKAKRREILQSHQRKAALIRAGWMIAPLPIYYLLQSQVSAATYLPVSVTFSTLGVFFSGGMSPQEELDKLDESHQVTYVCPSCTNHLGQLSWQAYHNQGKCARPGCGARYK